MSIPIRGSIRRLKNLRKRNLTETFGRKPEEPKGRIPMLKYGKG